MKKAAEQQPPEKHEGKPKAQNGEENGNGKSIADQSKEVPVPEVNPNPLGPGGTVPIPTLAGGRRKPPVVNKVVVTQAACPGAGQLNPEEEQLLIVRASYLKATTTPHFDGEGRVKEYDYVQVCKPSWTEDLSTFLRANGYKLVREDDAGEAIELGNVIDIEAQRLQRADAISG